MRSKIVLLGAMHQELVAYKYRYGSEVYMGLTGVGKPSAAAVTQKAIIEHNPKAVIFTGVGGSLDQNFKIGDLGIARAAIDADIDVRSWDKSYKRGELPFTKERVFYSDSSLITLAKQVSNPNVKTFDAYIASGSAFLDSRGKRNFITDCLPDLTTELDGKILSPNIYEMEGSAVLQTCNRNNIPCLALRAISDGFDGEIVRDFNEFVAGAIKNYIPIVDHIIGNV